MSGAIPTFLHITSYRLKKFLWALYCQYYVHNCDVCVCLRLAFLLYVCGQYLGVFAKFRKETISFAMYVCPSAWNNSARNGRIFMKFGIRIFLENL
jgi:hypothetical protein